MISWIELDASRPKPVEQVAVTSLWSPKTKSACVVTVRAETWNTVEVSSPAILNMWGIMESWQERLHSCLGGILRGLKGVAEGIGGAADHVHIMASLKATHCLADVMREIKSNSSEWVHSVIGNALLGWQDGYGAFTVGRSEVEAIKQYIREQKAHHRKKMFQEESLELLQQSGIESDERCLW